MRSAQAPWAPAVPQWRFDLGHFLSHAGVKAGAVRNNSLFLRQSAAILPPVSFLFVGMRLPLPKELPSVLFELWCTES
jgi:hypothetical protein